MEKTRAYYLEVNRNRPRDIYTSLDKAKEELSKVLEEYKRHGFVFKEYAEGMFEGKSIFTGGIVYVRLMNCFIVN